MGLPDNLMAVSSRATRSLAVHFPFFTRWCTCKSGPRANLGKRAERHHSQLKETGLRATFVSSAPKAFLTNLCPICWRRASLTPLTVPRGQQVTPLRVRYKRGLHPLQMDCGAMNGGVHCTIPRGVFKPLPPQGELSHERPGRMVHHHHLLSPTTSYIALVKLPQ